MIKLSTPVSLSSSLTVQVLSASVLWMHQETCIQLLQVNFVIFIKLDSFFQIIVRMFMNISEIDFQHNQLVLVIFIVISNKIVYCSIPTLKESFLQSHRRHFTTAFTGSQDFTGLN